MNNIEQLVKNASIILWACDFKGIITLQIGGNLEKLNMTQNFAVGSSIYEVLKGSEGFFEALKQSLEKKEKVEALYKCNGNYCQARISPTENGVIGVCSLETEKIVQDKINLINFNIESIQKHKEILAIFSHEMRTPLNGIIGILNLIKNDQPDLRYIDILQKNTDSMLNSLNDFLDFSKIENGKMEIEHKSFNLYKIIDDTILFFYASASKKEIKIKSNIIKLDKTKSFIGDENRIRQILNNLISNAIKFTPENGIINIDVNNIEYLFEICIIDSGKGISIENQNKLFKPYSQIENSPGTGLGLSICKNLIELMNGSIGYINDPSTFWIKIPLQKDDNIYTIPKNINNHQVGIIPKISIINKKVLLAEDDEINNLILCKYLYKLGFSNVISKKNGKDVLETLKKSVEKKEFFDYVLLDNKMPYLTGVEVSDIFSSIKTTEKVILVSGNIEITNDFLGIDSIIFKPYNINQIKKELNI